MKIDKRNAWHWAYLGLFGLNALLAILLRPFCHKRQRVLLYGHKLNGNLLAIYRRLRQEGAIDVAFVTMDPHYHRELVKAGERVVLATSPQVLPWLCTSQAVISDHGLHAMSPMVSLSDLKFFDVWHGIPFKGFDADDFRLQHRYDETWVASPKLAQLYLERFCFSAEKVKVTGYARIDRLVCGGVDADAIKRRLGLYGPEVGKLVLFAPTWKHDAREHSPFPFGHDPQTFFGALSAMAKRTQSTFIMRSHLNSQGAQLGAWERIVHLPHADYPDTEELLLVSDMLVCDWSSIAFDFLLLDRPTVFLDVPAPFAKGFSLGPGYRFGEIVANMEALEATLSECLHEPSSYHARFGETAARVRHEIYGPCADGEATTRCVERLRHHLAHTGP